MLAPGADRPVHVSPTKSAPTASPRGGVIVKGKPRIMSSGSASRQLKPGESETMKANKLENTSKRAGIEGTNSALKRTGH